QEFYQTLALGYPVDVALDEARKAIYEQDAHKHEWGAPVLFMRSPTGILFDTGILSSTEAAPASPPPMLPWQRWLPAIAAIGAVALLLLFLIFRPSTLFTPKTAATSPSMPMTATTAPAPTATVTTVPMVALYEWPSPTPALPAQVTIAVAPLAECDSPWDLHSSLQAELSRQITNTATVIEIKQTALPEDTAPAQQMAAQDMHLLIGGRCREDGQVELQVLFHEVPPPLDELLFEPEQLTFVTSPIYVRYFILAASLYALARPAPAAATLSVVPSGELDNGYAADRSWLEATLAAHQEDWRTAMTGFTSALAVRTLVSDTTQVYLLANLALAQREAAIESNEKALCLQDPASTYSQALTLAEQLSLPSSQLALLHVGRGLARHECPNSDNTQMIVSALEVDAQAGMAGTLPYGLTLRALVDYLNRDLVSAKEHACQALQLEPTLSYPYLILGDIYRRYADRQPLAQSYYESYGRLAHFSTQRVKASQRLNLLEQATENAPPGMDACD
ncbi:MAG: hypothetical protein R3E79_57710, partial [Caldilineaceae bacterium]